MQPQPYLFFEGRAEEAIAFYRAAIGAEVAMMMRFAECPEPTEMPPGSADKIMHATLTLGDGGVLMLSDGRCGGQAHFGGFALSLTPKDQATAERFFAALSEGGEVVMPLAKTFFSPCFGMVTDRFGVAWMINLTA